MDLNKRCIAVKIMQFVNDSFPGWVQCEFEDAEGKKHSLIDKVPLFTAKLIDSTSSYPQEGIVRCEILDESLADDKNRGLVRITIARPDTLESTQGLSEFVVLSAQLRPDPWFA
jgi:hypothetical protein